MAKIARITNFTKFYTWKETSMAKIARITNFTKFYTWKEERSRRASVSLQILQKSQK